MATVIRARVPLPPEETLALFRRAAEALNHHIREYAPAAGLCTAIADFSLRALATFRIEAVVAPAEGGSRLNLVVRPAFKLTPWTGTGQSELIGWSVLGKMQELTDPVRYRSLLTAERPARTAGVPS